MLALDKIIAEIEKGEVIFPTHADVAFRVRLALDDPEIPLARAAQLIQAEPLLASRVVGLANSVIFNRSGGSVADVRTAITRLGLRFVRALATAVVMRQMSGSIRSAAFRDLAGRLWEHTVHVAALSRLLAARFLPRMADTALFAGIVHEVSGFYLISRSDAYPDLFADGSLLSLEAERRVGRSMLAALAIPDEVVGGIEALWQSSVADFPPRELGDLLKLAHQLTPIQSPLQPPAVSDLAVALDADIEMQLSDIMEKSGEELDALTTALRY